MNRLSRQTPETPALIMGTGRTINVAFVRQNEVAMDGV